MTKEQEKDLTLREVAITGFQQLLRAGIANSYAGVFGEYEEGVLMQIISLFSLRSDKGILQLMKDTTQRDLELFTESIKEDGEELDGNPTLEFLNEAMSCILELEGKEWGE